MKVISIVNKKGGVGKTTTAIQLASWLEARYPGRVLAIDMDSQANFSFTAQSASSIGTYEVLTRAVPIEKAIQKRSGTFDLLSASSPLGGADVVINATGKEYRLREALSSLKSNAYDYVIIDTPPNTGVLTVNALTASDRAIIAAQADIYSLQGLKSLSEEIDDIKRYCNKSLTIDGILLTRFTPNMNVSKQLRKDFEAFAEMIGTRVYRTAITENTHIKESEAKQQSIFAFASGKNRSQKISGKDDYIKFCEEFMNDYDNIGDDGIIPI